jgi:hypothetical protein
MTYWFSVAGLILSVGAGEPTGRMGMSGIGGTWECIVETPVGSRSFRVELTPEGTLFRAHVTGNFGEMQIADGRLNGNMMEWTMPMRAPLALDLDCKAVVDGDSMAGTVSAGVFGKYPLTGTRLAADAGG